MRLPSTLITWRSGSTRAPNLRTICPSTSTRPSPMSSSACLRLPTPASARTFCRRTPPGTSVRLSLSSWSSYSSSSGSSFLALALRWLRPGVLILDVLNIFGQERRQIREVLEAGQAQPLEEVRGGPVQDRARLLVGPGLLDQAAQDQRAHDAVAVDPAHGRHADPADRLPVGHDGQGLQRCLGEADLLAVADEPLDERGAVLSGVEPPAARDLPEVEAAALGGVGRGEVVQFGGYLVPRPLEDLGQHHHGYRLVGDQEDRLQAGP